jgi:4-hydroxy-tetrahydrodipicolinate synthase
VEAVMAVTRAPVLLYNIPQCTHTPLAFAAVLALASDRRVLGVKDSWGDLPYFQRLLTLKADRPDFRVLQGSEPAASASLLLGADGLIPGLGNIAPRLMTALVDAAHRADAETCRRLHLQVMRLADVYTGTGIPGLYRACGLLGLGSGVPAEPWLPVDDAEAARIERALSEQRLLPVEAGA